MSFRYLRGISLLAGCASLALRTGADVGFGGNARASAMGGAGLAIVDVDGRNTRVNPASLALLDRRGQVGLPSIGLRASGVGIGEAWKHLTGNPSQNDVVGLARDFGKRDIGLGANLDWAFRTGHFEVTASAIGQAAVLPNPALVNWAKTANGDVTKLSGLEQAHGIGAAIYSLPTVGFAERVSPAGSPTQIEAGVRVKLMRSYYSHYVVSSGNIRNNTPAQPAPEMDGASSLSKNGLGLDFGFLAHPRDHRGLSGAFVVTNVLEPNFRYTGTDDFGRVAKYDLQPRSASAGVAYEYGRFVSAFDAIDVTRAYGNVQGRAGVEYRTRGIAYRAGYGSAAGFSVGVGWKWLDLAFGARMPIEVAQTLRF